MEYQKGISADIVVSDGTGAYASVVAAATNLKGALASVVALGKVYARQKLTGQVSINRSFPNSYYGIQEDQPFSLQIDNSDSSLNFMLAESPKGAKVRIKRYDAVSGALVTILDGSITKESIGDVVTLEGRSVLLDTFQKEIPRFRVYGSGAIPPTGLTTGDLTVNFPGAEDLNDPVSVIYGRVPYSPLSLVHSDEASQEFDYLVGEGILDVEEVFVDLNGVPTPKFSVTGTAQSGSTNSITLEALDAYGTANDLDGTAFYVGMWISIIDGTGVGQEQEILVYDKNTKLATVSGWTTPPDSTSVYQIREYTVLQGNPYAGRTAIRFRYKQTVDNNPLQLWARVVRFGKVYKNLLVQTNGLDKDSYWTRYNTVPKLINGYEGPFNDFDAFKFSSGASTSELVLQTLLNPVPTSSSKNLVASIWIKETDLSNSPALGFYVWLFDSSLTPISTQLIFFSSLRAMEQKNGWVRVAFTMWSDVSTLPSSPVYFGFSLDAGASCLISRPQLEVVAGSTPSWFEHVRNQGEGESFLIPDFLKMLLSDPVCLGEPVDEASFAQAVTDIGEYNMPISVAYPGIHNTSGTAQDIIDSITQLRGIRVTNNGGAWAIAVDKPITASGRIFGTSDTGYANIIELQDISPKATTDVIKSLKVNYGPTFKQKSAEPAYKFQMEYSSGLPYGVELEESLPMVSSHQTAQAYLQYKVNKSKYSSATLQLRLGQEGIELVPGDGIEIRAPRRQVENLLLNSESLNKTGWSGNTASITDRIGLDPEQKSYSASQVVRSSGVVGVTQSLGVFSGKDLYCAVSARSSTNTDCVFDLYLSTPSYTTPKIRTTVGVGWQRVEQVFNIPSSVTDTVSLRLDMISGTTLFLWGAQVTKNYKKPYVRTTSASIASQDTWQVIATSQSGIETIDATVVPYDSRVYDVSQLNFPSDSTIENTINLQNLPPPIAGNLSVPAAPPVLTSAAGANIADDGTIDSWANVEFTMPASNCSYVKVQRRLTSLSDGINRNLWEDCATANVGEYGLGVTARVQLHGFVPGLQYQIRTVAYNGNGYSSPDDIGAQTFVARGDSTAPNVPSSLSATQGTGRGISLKVGLPLQTIVLNQSNGTTTSVSVPERDLAYIHLYRKAITTGATPPTDPSGATLVERALKTTFTDINGITYGYDYYYWVRGEDYSGNVSDYYPSNTGVGVKITPAANAAPDVAVNTLTFNKLILGSVDNLVENPSFEMGDIGWEKNAGWTIVNGSTFDTYSAGKWHAESGVVAGSTVSQFMATGSFYTCNGGDTFAGQAWFKCKVGATPNFGGTTPSTAYAVVTFYDINATPIGANFLSVGITQSVGQTWTKQNVRATAPANANFVRFQLATTALYSGAWVADGCYFRKQVESSILGPIVIDASDAGSADSIKVVASTGSEIGFYDSDTTTKIAAIDVISLGLQINPNTTKAKTLFLGKASKEWTNISIRTQKLTIEGDAVVNSGPTGGVSKYVTTLVNGVTYFIELHI